MFDSHAHVSDAAYDNDRDAVIERAFDGGVVGWIEVGTNVTTSTQAVDLAARHERVYASVGVHPSDIASMTATDWTVAEGLIENRNVVAIGEVGLDYYRGGTGAEQLPVLQKFYEYARMHALPMIFHVRDGAQTSAHDDLLAWLEALPKGKQPRGVIHTFSGTMAHAKRYLALDLYLSFSGVVTFKNGKDVLAVAASVPDDKILAETDSPYLTPEPHRGMRNEPAYVGQVVQKIAAERHQSAETFAAITMKNAVSLFGLSG